MKSGKSFITCAALAAIIGFKCPADVTSRDGTLTISGGTNLTVATENDLKALGTDITNVVVDAATLTFNLAADQSLALSYAFKNDATVAVTPAERKVSMSGVNFFKGSFGYSFAKRGAGEVYLDAKCGAVDKTTRLTIYEGCVHLGTGDFFGSHSGTTTNLTIDVREGATFDASSSHCPVGPVELTGATWLSNSSSVWDNYWTGTSFKGGITAHASSVISRVYITYWDFIGQPGPGANNTNFVANVEDGAELAIYGKLREPKDFKASFTKRGGGTLYLYGPGTWTGGTVLEGGKIVLADAGALGTGSVTIAGDVEIEVVRGVSVTIAELKGAGHVTTSGAGGIAFTSKAETVTGAENRTAVTGLPIDANGVLTLSQMTTDLNVPAGTTVAVSNVVVAEAGLTAVADITKSGAGTLVLNKGLRGKYRGFTLKEGTLEFGDIQAFGTDGVTTGSGLTVTGGTLRPTKSLSIGSEPTLRITYTGSTGGLNVPQGVSFQINSNFFYSANATVTKTGTGEWQLNTVFATPLAQISGTRWVIDEGSLVINGGNTFGTHGTCWAGTIEIHENGELCQCSRTGHLPLGPIVLRGGTLREPYDQYDGGAWETAGGCQWGGFAFNGGITALASTQPSRVIGRVCFTGHESYLPEFNVEAGAVLEMDTALMRGYTYKPGRQTRADGDLVKSGEGTLRLLRPLSIKGTFDIQGGTVELKEGGYIDPVAAIVTRPGAKLLLNDGTRFVATADLAPDIVRAADVWVDATRISASDGATLSTIANLGTARGSFAKFPKAVSGGIIPNAPKFVAAGKGIGGKASIGFDGTMALALDAYQNTGTNCESFVVGVWTNYYNAGGKGCWGGTISLGSVKMSGNEDQYNIGVLSGFFSGGSTKAGENQGPTYVAVFFGEAVEGDGNTRSSCSATIPTLSINEPFVLRMRRGPTNGDAQIWRSDSVAKTLTLASYTTKATPCRIDRVAIGTRLMTGGCATTYSGSASRNLIGQIGEVLVFSKILTDAERAAVNDYLRRKWIGTAATQPAGSGTQVEVETPQGAKAAFVVTAADGSESAQIKVTKGGAGAAVIGGGTATSPLGVAVEEGTLRLQSECLASRVPLWIDADDSATTMTDAEGHITNLVNKGFCGGSFTLAASASVTPHYPTLKAAGINGRATINFDGEAALMTDAYTNNVSPRRFSIYAVWRRNQWRLNPNISNGGGYGKWATIYTFVPNKSGQDESIPGVFHMDENSATTATAEFGNVSPGVTMPVTGTTTLFVSHTSENGYYVSFETNATSATSVPRTVNGNDVTLEPLQVERVILGGRSVSGKVHYYGPDQTSNRCWYGDLAEMIVTTEPLSYDEEIELLAYLRKKWMNKGDGSATAPTWLTGVAAAPVFGSNTAIAMADGTALVSDANTLTLGSLETQGTVDWTRLWSGEKEDAEAFALFNASAISLGTIRLWPVPAVHRCEVKVLGFGEKAGANGWQVYRPDGRLRTYANVTERDSAYWLLDEAGFYFILK